MPSRSELKSRYFALMRRAVHVLSLLPDPETCDTSDAAVMADVTMLLSEFNKVDAEMNEILTAAKCVH
jgi:hypothetical protein